jgi:hypothetical protein
VVVVLVEVLGVVDDFISEHGLCGSLDGSLVVEFTEGPIAGEALLVFPAVLQDYLLPLDLLLVFELAHQQVLYAGRITDLCLRLLCLLCPLRERTHIPVNLLSGWHVLFIGASLLADSERDLRSIILDGVHVLTFCRVEIDVHAQKGRFLLFEGQFIE